MGFLRLLLAVSILIYHAGPIGIITLIENHIAVQLFFIISGFMISYVLDQKYMKNKKQNIRLFYINRFFRIFPIYWVILALTLSFSLFIAKDFSITPLGNAVKLFNNLSFNKIGEAANYLFNTIFIVNIKSILNAFPNNIPLLIIPAWTLHVEIIFYIIVPFIYKRSIKSLVGLLIVGLSCRFIFYSLHFFGSKLPDGQFFPIQFIYFILGILSYRLYLLFYMQKIVKRLSKYIFFATIAFALCYQFLPFNWRIWHIHPINWLFELTITAAFPFIFIATKNNMVDRFFGRITYAVYLIHMLVLQFLINNRWLTYTGEYQTIIVLLIAFLCAIMIDYLGIFVRGAINYKYIRNIS